MTLSDPRCIARSDIFTGRAGVSFDPSWTGRAISVGIEIDGQLLDSKASVSCESTWPERSALVAR